MAVTDSEEVLVASTASGATMPSSCPNRFPLYVQILDDRFDHERGSPRERRRLPGHGDAGSLAFRPPRRHAPLAASGRGRRDAALASSAAPRGLGERPGPEAAAIWAMPRPMVPEPMMPKQSVDAWGSNMMVVIHS